MYFLGYPYQRGRRLLFVKDLQIDGTLGTADLWRFRAFLFTFQARLKEKEQKEAERQQRLKDKQELEIEEKRKRNKDRQEKAEQLRLDREKMEAANR